MARRGRGTEGGSTPWVCQKFVKMRGGVKGTGRIRDAGHLLNGEKVGKGAAHLRYAVNLLKGEG